MHEWPDAESTSASWIDAGRYSVPVQFGARFTWRALVAYLELRRWSARWVLLGGAPLPDPVARSLETWTPVEMSLIDKAFSVDAILDGAMPPPAWVLAPNPVAWSLPAHSDLFALVEKDWVGA